MGAGKVFGAYDSYGEAPPLPVVGLGARYRLLPYERLNFRFDASYGLDGMVFYFGVREAF